MTPPGFGSTARATLNVGGRSVSFEATGRAKDETPTAVAFATKAGQTAGAAVTSEIVQLRDHDGVNVSVSGGASYRVCSDASCSGNEAFTSAAGTAATNSWIQLRQTAPAAGQGQNATLTYGTLSTAWRVESAAPPAASCPGAYMRARSPYGFEALFCGWSQAPNLSGALFGNAAGYEFVMYAEQSDGCHYSANMVINSAVGVRTSTRYGSSGYLAACGPTNFASFWQSFTGTTVPVDVIVLSKGAMPPSWEFTTASRITWSK